MNGMARRRRIHRAVAIVAVVVAGLLSRSPLAVHLAKSIKTNAGDTLWALALFLSLGLLLPKIPTITVAFLALVIACGIELSQLYQAPWINRLGRTDLGGLILGFVFKWTDLACYTSGVLPGTAGECTRFIRVRPKTVSMKISWRPKIRPWQADSVTPAQSLPSTPIGGRGPDSIGAVWIRSLRGNDNRSGLPRTLAWQDSAARKSAHTPKTPCGRKKLPFAKRQGYN
ncbi:MAG: DUF2809 domain-containing protein [Phycisphaerales bacterium]|nr:MAG: DUF2809 domain-containing protein [Phycisphaerales bacterium]